MARHQVNLYTQGGNNAMDEGNNAVRVNVVAGGGAGGTSSNFGAAFPGTGTAAGAKDSGGNMAALNLDASGFLKVNVAAGSGGNGAAGNTGAAVPTQADYLGVSVAGTLRGTTGYDIDSSGVTHEYALGINLRKSAAGGSVEAATLTNPLRIDPTGATTQPVSGTVTANQGGAPWSQNITQVGGSALALGQAAMAASLPVVLASNQSAVPISTPKSSTSSAPAQGTIGTTAGQAVAANANRKKLIIQNTGTTVLKLSLGGTSPTQTAYHVALGAGTSADDGSGGIWVDDMWTGAVQIISSAAGGTYVLTELS